MPKTTPKSSKSGSYHFAVGRRKSAIATVKVFLTAGDSLVNKIPLASYFHSLTSNSRFDSPFSALKVAKYYFTSKIAGGGIKSQSDALLLALARALQKVSPEANTTVLRSANMLSVDPRHRQRRMVGTGGKARRAKQSPKR